LKLPIGEKPWRDPPPGKVRDAGYVIGVGVVDEPTRRIDTLEDYAAFVARTKRGALA
jgi:hypothetical protein